jgi:hypothetical protein
MLPGGGNAAQEVKPAHFHILSIAQLPVFTEQPGAILTCIKFKENIFILLLQR